MANSFTNPTWVKSRPHASAEKQVGDSDPALRADVINRTVKSLTAVSKRLITSLWDGITVDLSDAATVSALATSGMLIPRHLDRSVAIQEALNTAAETNLYAVTVPAATLGTTRTIFFTGIADYLNNSGVDRSVTIRCYYGATAFLNATFGALSTSPTRRPVRIVGELAAGYATGVQYGQGTITVGVVNVDGTMAVPFGHFVGLHNAVAEDSTAGKNFTLSVQHSGAAATISFILRKINLWIV